jgi:2-dehydro-3-deoxyphosphogluconate aldolase/(4S)-4-hydroxy-2-oxoglutarate aldolase
VSPAAALRHTRARQRTVDQLVAHGAVAVVRLSNARLVREAVNALHAGGVRAVELTMTTPDALAVIEELARWMGDELLVGAGSVLGPDAARRAIDAGAEYVVSPVFRRAVVEEAHRQGVPAMPGAFTPTEILTAHDAGADLVKVFPADSLGPAFIKGVLAPMPFLRLMPTGGVTPDNAGEWLRAGAYAVGLGSALVDPKLVASGDLAGLTERARRVTAQVAEARTTHPVTRVDDAAAESSAAASSAAASSAGGADA